MRPARRLHQTPEGASSYVENHSGGSAAATIALTAVGVTAGGATAAVTPVKKPIHLALVCRAG